MDCKQKIGPKAHEYVPVIFSFGILKQAIVLAKLNFQNFSQTVGLYTEPNAIRIPRILLRPFENIDKAVLLCINVDNDEKQASDDNKWRLFLFSPIDRQ